MSEFLFGFGFDIHPLVVGVPLFLGGVEIPSEIGALGHSDGDALLHAIIDGSLSASGLPDIGTLFPDTDPRYRNISSVYLLEETLTLIRDRGLKFYQVDATLVLDRPRISPFYEAIKSNLAKLLEIPPERVGLKARRSEGVLFPSEKPAVMVFALVVLKKTDV